MSGKLSDAVKRVLGFRRESFVVMNTVQSVGGRDAIGGRKRNGWS
jgi:hypothetical protein